ncbi:hypothetical protein CJJ09_003695 [Candidozyma auris]|nr:hypothetical protein CJJ09_003695 [[Candida] auris]
MVSILYVWAKCNPTIGYKQGMHEILGLMFLNIRKESVSLPQTNTVSADDRQILSLYDEKYLEHDLFTIFNRFFVTSGVVSQFFASEADLMASINVFNIYLMKVDQLIHYNLVTKLRLESQLWVIRYFRLMLLRELGNDLEVPSLLWDKLAAMDAHTGSDLVPDTIAFLVVVLLVHIKSELIKSVICTLDKKNGVGDLACKICGQSFQTAINSLSQPVDIYSDWIDACEDLAEEAEARGADLENVEEAYSDDDDDAPSRSARDRGLSDDEY